MRQSGSVKAPAGAVKPVRLHILAVALSMLAFHYQTPLWGAVQVDGVCIITEQGISRTSSFTAVFDSEELRIGRIYQNPLPTDRYGPQPMILTNYTYVGPSGVMSWMDIGAVSIPREEDLRLGLIGSPGENCIFLTIRCLAVFRPEDTNARLAVPWAIGGDPLGVITTAEYGYTTNGPAITLEAAMTVSEELYNQWRTSDLIGPEYSPDAVRSSPLHAVASSELSAYSPGQTLTDITLSGFTNVAALTFPTQANVRKYRPKSIGESSEAMSSTRAVVKIHRITELSPGSRISPLPIEGELWVADYRVYSRRHGIPLGRYFTNRLDTMEISPLAIAALSSSMEAFEAQMGRRGSHTRGRGQQAFMALMLVAIVGGGIVLYAIGRRTASGG